MFNRLVVVLLTLVGGLNGCAFLGCVAQPPAKPVNDLKPGQWGSTDTDPRQDDDSHHDTNQGDLPSHSFTDSTSDPTDDSTTTTTTDSMSSEENPIHVPPPPLIENPFEERHWNYERNGADWIFTRCNKPTTADGTRCYGKCQQSPINIDPAHVIPTTTTTTTAAGSEFIIRAAYSNAVTEYILLDNGHDIEIRPPTGRTFGLITVNDVVYKTKTIHFHSDSEHTIGVAPLIRDPPTSEPKDIHSHEWEMWASAAWHYNLGYLKRPLEMHIVHVNQDPSLHDVVVVSISFDLCATIDSETNPALELILKNPLDGLPDKEERKIGPSHMATFDLASLVREAGPDAYRYVGSLTTPPLTQGVKWVVFHKPVLQKKAVLKKYRDALLLAAKCPYETSRLIQNSPYTMNHPNPEIFKTTVDLSDTVPM